MNTSYRRHEYLVQRKWALGINEINTWYQGSILYHAKMVFGMKRNEYLLLRGICIWHRAKLAFGIKRNESWYEAKWAFVIGWHKHLASSGMRIWYRTGLAWAFDIEWSEYFVSSEMIICYRAKLVFGIKRNCKYGFRGGTPRAGSVCDVEEVIDPYFMLFNFILYSICIMKYT